MSSLKERIKKAQEKHTPRPAKKTRYNLSGFHVSIELVAGIMVGVALGYAADSYFKTPPWLTLIGFLTGCAAGLYNVYKFTQKMKEKL